MKTTLTIDGTRFRINGEYTYAEIPNCPEAYHGLLMNARFIQGIFDDKVDAGRFNRFGRTFDADRNTEDLIAALPAWHAAGLRAFTVGFQGGGPCFTMMDAPLQNNAFSEDGTMMDPAYLARMDRLIRAADKVGMAVIVSFFYVGQVRFLKDDLAVTNAVKTASNWLRDQGYTNVIIEIANEHDVEQYRVHPILFDQKGIVKLIEIAKRESGGMPVGCSTTGAYFSEDIGNASDVIIIHGNNMSRQVYHNHIKEAKRITPARPIITNEDSQCLSHLQVALDNGVSWGYYNNMTKQEPPADWGITEGEDTFFAERMAESLGIHVAEAERPLEDCFYLQGLSAEECWQGKRWIRLASKYPERIHKVDFYRNGKYFDTAYDDPFTINFYWNWMQFPVEGIEAGERWEAVITLSDGRVFRKQKIAE